MEIHKIKANAPDVQIVMTWKEACALHDILFEAKSYADDHSSSTIMHDKFIEELSEVVCE